MIDEIFDHFISAQVFENINVKNAYHRLGISEGDV